MSGTLASGGVIDWGSWTFTGDLTTIDLIAATTGVYQHSDGRPLLGRKLAGKSQRELRDLGLAPPAPPAST